MTINNNSLEAKLAAKKAQQTKTPATAEATASEASQDTPDTFNEAPEETLPVSNEPSTGYSEASPIGEIYGKASKQNSVHSKQILDQIKELNLPPHISAWDVTENPYNPERVILTFYVEETPITYIEVTIENLEELLTVLNSYILFMGDTEITGWSIRQPENPELPALLSLLSNGSVASTLPLDKEVLHKLVPALLKLYDPTKKTGGNRFINWVVKHYILSSLTGIIFLILLVSSINNAFF